jgi:hypothetical protein
MIYERSISGRFTSPFFGDKINKEERDKHTGSYQGKLGIGNGNYGSHKQISQYKNDGQNGIEFHGINTCAIKMSRPFAQNKYGSGRSSHADRIEKNGETEYLVELIRKKQYDYTDSRKYRETNGEHTALIILLAK